MALPFEFVVSRAPVSQQARRRERVREWIQDVRAVAARHWGVEPAFDRAVTVIITYFYDGTLLDVDNIPKPILDALKYLVYSDDGEVTDLLCRKRTLDDGLNIADPSPVLKEAFGQRREFVHVIVIESSTLEVNF